MSGPTLAIDSCSQEMSAAIAEGGRILSQATAESRSGPRLLALVGQAVHAAGLQPRDLTRIVALCGPGSFTGVRITLATALGLAPAATASGSPDLRTISTLAALALQAPMKDGPVLAAVDALRGEYFTQAFAPHEERWVTTTPPTRRSLSELFASPSSIPFWLSAAPAFEWSGGMRIVPHLAAGVARHASIDPEDPIFSRAIEPIYLRSPAVTLPKARNC